MEATTRFRDLTVAQFIDQLASGEPVPGGGAAAAIAGSLGGALVAMVSALSDGRPKYAAHQDLITGAKAAGLELADRFLALADEDANAFAGFGVAMKLPRDTDEEKAARAAAISEAAVAATQAPFKTVQACAEMVAWAEALAGRSNKNASSDLEVAALMAVAAAEAAAANVYVNLPSIADQALATDLLERTKHLADEIDRTAAITRKVVRSGEAREPLPESAT
jgi:methenyltetrahydrofolate cyclohydrolase